MLTLTYPQLCSHSTTHNYAYTHPPHIHAHTHPPTIMLTLTHLHSCSHSPSHPPRTLDYPTPTRNVQPKYPRRGQNVYQNTGNHSNANSQLGRGGGGVNGLQKGSHYVGKGGLGSCHCEISSGYFTEVENFQRQVQDQIDPSDASYSVFYLSLGLNVFCSKCASQSV
jgi:hypothetical protein